jgi:tRNA(Ile2) C34 agmatinyltransferase TiaS
MKPGMKCGTCGEQMMPDPQSIAGWRCPRCATEPMADDLGKYLSLHEPQGSERLNPHTPRSARTASRILAPSASNSVNSSGV